MKSSTLEATTISKDTPEVVSCGCGAGCQCGQGAGCTCATDCKCNSSCHASAK